MTFEEVATYLQAEGLGTTAVTIFVGALPPDPDDCMAILPYQGPAPEQVLGNENVSTEHDRFQLRVRARSMATAINNCKKAQRAFVKVCNETLSGCAYLSIDVLGSLHDDGKDDNGRWEFHINCEAQKAPSAVS